MNIKCMALTAVLTMLVFTTAALGGKPPKNGIGLRGGYWNILDGGGHVFVHDDDALSRVKVGGYGGSLYFFSRLDDQLFAELTLGAIASVEELTRSSYDYDDYNDVDVAAVSPILMGIRYDLLPLHVKSSLQPYAAAGAGAYMVSDILVRERYRGDDVTVLTRTRPGGYLGAGMNLMLGTYFALNYDMKYHWVDFRSDRYQNGFELGIGFSVMWGSY